MIKRIILGTATVVALAALAVFVRAGSASAAGTSAGNLTVIDGAGSPLPAGGSATQFALRPPQGAACAGDSANGGWRVQSFMVSSGIDVAALRFPLDESTGTTFREYLFSDGGTPFKDQNTAVTTGFLTGLPLFDFSVFGETDVPAGTYTLGFYCSKAGAGDRYWATQFTVTHDPADSGPARLHWALASATPVTTTTAATPTTAATTTTAVTTTSSTTTEQSVAGSAPGTTEGLTSSTITDSTTASGGPQSGDTTTTVVAVLASTGWNSGLLVGAAFALLSLGWIALRVSRRQPGVTTK